MGWRSWNCYHGDVSQKKIEATIDAIVDTSRGTSLLELGFSNVGVDDGWQVRVVPTDTATDLPAYLKPYAHARARSGTVGMWRRSRAQQPHELSCG